MRYIISSSIPSENIIENLGASHKATSVEAVYPVRVSPHYASLIGRQNDAIWRQCIPDLRELDDTAQSDDPLDENRLSPVPGLVHRYPDRVVLLVSNRCPVYCRFCMRKRHVGQQTQAFDKNTFDRMVAYIGSHAEIRDVVLSGGDPLMLDDESLNHILGTLSNISNVSIIRIGTRTPVTLPERITPELCRMLRRHHPIYINTHFNHPAEITAASAHACAMLADAGIPLGNQSVLLAGINDSQETMRDLLRGLLELRVKPYYLHQMDLVRGTAHFRTPVTVGLDIIRALRGHISGMAIPQFVIDLPQGKGKVALLPDPPEIRGEYLLLKTTGERLSGIMIMRLAGNYYSQFKALPV